MTKYTMCKSSWLNKVFSGLAHPVVLRHFLLLGVAGCGANGQPVYSSDSAQKPAVISTAAPVVTAPAAPAVPAPVEVASNGPSLGINVSSAVWYSGERSLANLLSGSGWENNSWKPFDPTRIDAAGNVQSLLPNERAFIFLTPPADAHRGPGTRIRCTYDGKGAIWIDGSLRKMDVIDHGIEFDWTANSGNRVWVTLGQIDAADPLRNLDCRETTLPRSARFAPEFLETMKPYSVIRFLDWSPANNNLTVTWAKRTAANAINQIGADGVAMEHQVALANEVKADPWFNLSWNADETYVRKFAEYVHANLAPGRRAYVELSNEVWNGAFPVADQARREGQAAGLSDNAYEAQLRRYSQKTAWAMKIWTEVFADNPKRLVRVIATQHVNPWGAGAVLSFGDTAKYVDALATAPYFGHDAFGGDRANMTDVNQLFPVLAADAETAINRFAAENKAIAEKYGKRYIAYEAGQHVIKGNDAATVGNLNRDNRMYDIYKSYLAAWRVRVGDLMVMYQATGGIGPYGAWGLREYAGQPLSETPKRRAVLEEAAKLPR